MSEDKLKIDSEGNFYKWKRVFEVEGRAEKHPTVAGHGFVPGADLPSLIGSHLTKQIRIIIEVRNES